MKNCKIIMIMTSIFMMSTMFSQNCEDGFTYFPEIPNNVTNINNNENCFSNDDLAALSDIINLNSMSYATALDIGTQRWVSSKLVSWVATYSPNGSNGVNEKISSLPSSIGNFTNLESLYLEWNDLEELPNDFSNLTSLKNLAISNNYLSSLPDIGTLTNLIFLDLGYNQLIELPESIENLESLNYLWIFNNQIQSLPESICDLNLTWSGVDSNNYPYFASGANQLCESSLIPDCVENSSNFEISLDQFYYSFLEDTPQDCDEECTLGDMNGDGGWNVLDIVGLANCVLASSCSDL